MDRLYHLGHHTILRARKDKHWILMEGKVAWCSSVQTFVVEVRIPFCTRRYANTTTPVFVSCTNSLPSPLFVFPMTVMASSTAATASATSQLTGASQVLGDHVCRFCGSEDALRDDPDHKDNCVEYLKMMKVTLEEQVAVQRHEASVASSAKRKSMATLDDDANTTQPTPKTARTSNTRQVSASRPAKNSLDNFWGCGSCQSSSCPYLTCNAIQELDNEYDPRDIPLPVTSWKNVRFLLARVASGVLQSHSLLAHNKYVGGQGQDEQLQRWVWMKSLVVQKEVINHHWPHMRLCIKLGISKLRMQVVETVRHHFIGTSLHQGKRMACGLLANFFCLLGSSSLFPSIVCARVSLPG